jgi:hypothetical protein
MDTLLAGAGFGDGVNYKDMEDNNITGYIPVHSLPRFAGGSTKAPSKDFLTNPNTIAGAAVRVNMLIFVKSNTKRIITKNIISLPMPIAKVALCSAKPKKTFPVYALNM